MSSAPNGIFPRNGVPAPQAAPGALDSADATCNELFYAAKCNPRFDVQSMNTIISEIVSAVNCAGLTYDCDRLDNLCRAIKSLVEMVTCEESQIVLNPTDRTMVLCGPSGIERITPEDFLANACFNKVEDIGSRCGNTKQLIFVDVDGCYRLATVETNSGQGSKTGGFWAVASGKPPNTSGYVLPDDFPTPNYYYNLTDFRNDGGTDPNDRSGLDNTKIENALIAALDEPFQNPCNSQFDFLVRVAFTPEATAEEAYSRSCNIGYRYRVDGGDWLYPFISGTGLITAFGDQNSIAGNYNLDTVISLPAGAIDFELFYIAPDYNASTPVNARLQANTFDISFGVPSPRFTLYRRV